MGKKKKNDAGCICEEALNTVRSVTSAETASPHCFGPVGRVLQNKYSASMLFSLTSVSETLDFSVPDSELLMLAPCLGHSDFIIQAPSSNKASLQPVRSSSFFFPKSQGRHGLLYKPQKWTGYQCWGKEKKPYKKNMVVFSELQVPKLNLIQHCSQKETDCLLLNSRNSHYLAPTA